MVCNLISAVSIYIAFEYTSRLSPFFIEQCTLASFLYVMTISKAAGWKVSNAMWVKHLLILSVAFAGKVYVTHHFSGLLKEWSGQINVVVILYLVACSLVHNPHMLINTTGSLML